MDTFLLKKTGPGQENTPTFDDANKQREATQGPTQLRHQQHDEIHTTTIVWVKITQC